MVASHHIFGKCCKLTSPAALQDTSCFQRLGEGATAVNANSISGKDSSGAAQSSSNSEQHIAQA
jgi:hypothetical protein